MFDGIRLPVVVTLMRGYIGPAQQPIDRQYLEFFLNFFSGTYNIIQKSRAMRNQKINLLTSRMIAWLAIVDGKIELPDRGFNRVEPQLNPAKKQS